MGNGIGACFGLARQGQVLTNSAENQDQILIETTPVEYFADSGLVFVKNPKTEHGDRNEV